MIILAGTAVAIHFVRIGQESFWTDEVNSLNSVRGGIIRMSLEMMSSPPLFFVLLKGWMILFGESHPALRSMSAILGGLAVPALFFCARQWNLGRLSSITAAAWLMLHPTVYSQSQQNRYYALLLLLGILWLATYPGLIWGTSRRIVYWPHILSGFLGFLTHYYFALYVLAGITAVSVFCLARYRSGGIVGWKRICMTKLVLVGMICLLIPLMLIQFDNGPMGPKSFIPEPTLFQLLDIYSRLYWTGSTFQGFLCFAVSAPLTLLAVTGLFFYSRKCRATVPTTHSCSPASSFGFLLCLSIVPNLVAFLISFIMEPIFLPERYSTLFLPSFMLWAVTGWNMLSTRIRKPVAVVAICLLTCTGMSDIRRQWNELQMFDWQGAINRVEKDWKPGDVTVFCPGWLVMNYRNNGGEPRGIIAADQLDQIRNAGRIWLIAWEQSPEEEILGPLVRMRAEAGHPFILKWPDITLSLIEKQSDGQPGD
jgi:hypothetical protein